MSTSHVTLKFLRKVHLYIGVFISPALLFFAFSGAMQTFSLHEATPGRDYKPPAWAVTMAQIHKKQTDIVPVKKPRPADAPAGDKPGKASNPDGSQKQHKAPDVPAGPPTPAPKSHLPLKIFFLLVAIGLFISTITGIYMSYKYTRNKLLITLLLIAGFVIPIVLLPF
jgi:hypothetical protein